MGARRGIESSARNSDPKSTSGAAQMIHLDFPGVLRPSGRKAARHGDAFAPRRKGGFRKTRIRVLPHPERRFDDTLGT
jgi:hypothetical protein